MLEAIFTSNGSSINLFNIIMYTGSVTSLFFLARGGAIGFLVAMLVATFYFFVAQPGIFNSLMLILFGLLMFSGTVNMVSGKWNPRKAPMGAVIICWFAAIMAGLYSIQYLHQIVEAVSIAMQPYMEPKYVPAGTVMPGVFGFSTVGMLVGSWMLSRNYTSGWSLVSLSGIGFVSIELAKSGITHYPLAGLTVLMLVASWMKGSSRAELIHEV
ncbi:hypothetical protein PQC39_gp073 [Vibrio phage Vp_R1]|uniref:Uncharacterized protein n=1 Tax=Vibrio phage Vp_R1 TaxID=2059867 RepID=A0A2H5BQ29_9CAUD|nr:hypothetical protein PQC39_gp073 [Vibrio phage Vp_R1]AUG88437.1 hypothetical protein VPR_073 [Vibrio phage Vp_R1]